MLGWDEKKKKRLLWITTQWQSGFLQADGEVLNTSSVLQQHKAVAARVSCASALSVRCDVLEPSCVWPQRNLLSFSALLCTLLLDLSDLMNCLKKNILCMLHFR